MGGSVSGLDTSVPQSARVYDYWLGGKDNFAADRELAEAIAARLPTIRAQVREQRRFLGRAVRYLVREAGVRQFLDIGTGIPAADNTHEVAQELAPDARVVYVDNDPIVLSHARALMDGTASGRTTFIQADLRRPDELLSDPTVSATLDLSEPVALMLIGIMHHLRDSDDPQGILATLLDGLPSGSYLVLQQVTADVDPDTMGQVKAVVEQGGIPYVTRSLDATRAFFAGLELVEPGLVPMLAWRPDAGPERAADKFSSYVGVARKT